MCRCHVILFALAVPMLFPFMDSIHSMMLFWLRPGRDLHKPIFNLRQRKQRRSIVIRYGALFLLCFAGFAALIAVPVSFPHWLTWNCGSVCNL